MGAVADPTSLSPHLRRLAGLDLVGAAPPVVEVEEVHECAVVLSRSRSPAVEVHLERCRADGVPVIIRPSGGGAVVLAPGMVAASLVAPRVPPGGLPEVFFRRFVTAVGEAIGASGGPATVLRGVSDLCVGDQKVAGSSLRLAQRTVLFQIAILVDPDLSLLDRYLPMPSRMPAYRRQRPHREFVTSLARCGSPVAVGQLVAQLRRSLGDAVAALAGCG